MASDKKIESVKKLLESAENNIKAAKAQVSEILGNTVKLDGKSRDFLIDDKIIEGKFNGESMMGDDGKNYPVPANYASKSKLIEGDCLKLSISEDGSFIFKQIGPIERKKLVGILTKNGDQYVVEADNQKYKILTASVTYFKGKSGDEVTITVPESAKSEWAAVEAIINK